jgi:CBS domain containing-hemolysin-like protein
MQKARQVIGIVTNRAGDCVGLVTIKDLVEEIVGELEDW